MRSSFSTKLLVIPAAAALAFLLIIAMGMFTSRRLHQHIESIEARYVPMIELQPRLEGELERMRQGFQDAVAAQDLEAVDAVHAHEQALLDALTEAASVVRPTDAATLRIHVTQYFEIGRTVSRRLISGETGEALVESMSQMQRAYARTAEDLQRATAFDRGELTSAFHELREANALSQRLSIGIAVACMALVLTLAVGIGRGVSRSLGELSEGFARFGEEQFDQPMQIRSHDELGEAARSANQMAAKLRQAEQSRRAAEWVKTGQAGIALALQGDLEPEAVARQAVLFVGRHLSALAGALYLADEDGAFRRVAAYAPSGSDSGERTFARGQGLVGEAALGDRLLEVDAAGAHIELVRAGVGDVRPHALVLVPVRDQDTTVAVLELALARPLTDAGRELLTTLRGTLATGLSVARSQAARRALLTETQRQAARLAEQEEHLVRANAALETKQRDLQKANDELRQQTAELDSFSYSVSHDLRAPLRAIDGFTRILLEDHAPSLDDEGKRVAHVVRANTQKMGQLIDDLLAFARLGRQPVNRARVDMDALAREAFAEARDAEPSRNIELHIDGALPPAWGDGALLRQVWSNLITNAVKYTRPRAQARIDIHATQTADGVEYAVRDNGVGFDMKYVHKLFGVFQRLHGANEFEGTGVGLALVSRVVQKHGGRAKAESSPGAGATFSFTLPTPPASPAGE